MTSKILVVDDGLDRKILGHILTREGYEVYEAADGAEGLRLCLDHKPDLILLDVNMPKLDGFSLLSLLQKDERTASIPIIFLTALDEARDKIIGLELGAVDYITKPYDLGEVTARIRNQLKIYHLTQELRRANEELREKQRQLNEDLKAAAAIQKSLLPSTHLQLDLIDVEWRFYPCDLIGGDIFNFLHLRDDFVAFYMIDVSGHGVPAAMVTVSINQTLQYYKEKTSLMGCSCPDNIILSPSKLLLSLDKEYPMERFDKYFTMAYLVLNRRNGALVYANAAHPPPVLLESNGGFRLLEEGGSIIGLGGSIPFFEGMVTLNPGDKVVLYTDGLVDYQNDRGEFFGEDRFYQFLKAHAAAPLPHLTAELFQTLEKFGNKSKLRDDVSFLAFLYRGKPEQS
ncbi:MAG: PP2C family protein-serine/threonine phosphatase [Desulfobacca sp.]|uniref:PP2C family protein-serine/threonine phosphatase n=1 Tax=Desulfobacca sp. TaxID=2067990 RepID=UPI0040490EFC